MLFGFRSEGSGRSSRFGSRRRCTIRDGDASRGQFVAVYQAWEEWGGSRLGPTGSATVVAELVVIELYNGYAATRRNAHRKFCSHRCKAGGKPRWVLAVE